MRARLEQAIIEWMPRIVAGLCGVALMLTITAVYTLIKYQETNDAINETQTAQVYQVRESQFVNCVRSGNTLRRQVRNEFIGLKRDVLIPVFARIAETIPQGAPTKMILDDAVGLMHYRIHTIDDRIPAVNCRKRYPPLPGQHFAPVYPNAER